MKPSKQGSADRPWADGSASLHWQSRSPGRVLPPRPGSVALFLQLDITPSRCACCGGARNWPTLPVRPAPAQQKSRRCREWDLRYLLADLKVCQPAYSAAFPPTNHDYWQCAGACPPLVARV
jgi:hypothetical protein